MQQSQFRNALLCLIYCTSYFIRHLLVSHSWKGFLGELYVRSCGYRFTSCNRMDGLVAKWLEQWSEQMSWIWYMIPGESEVYFHGLMPVSVFLDPVKKFWLLEVGCLLYINNTRQVNLISNTLLTFFNIINTKHNMYL